MRSGRCKYCGVEFEIPEAGRGPFWTAYLREHGYCDRECLQVATDAMNAEMRRRRSP